MGGIKSGTYTPAYKLLLAGISPAICVKSGVATKATMHKLVVFHSLRNKKMTLAALSAKCGITVKTCWALKQLQK